MSRPLRFVVIGDTHYCWAKHHSEPWRRQEALGNVPDYIRYMEMRETVGAPLLEKIAALQPELVISTGDYVEGGLETHPEQAAGELLDGWEMLNRSRVPVLIAKGTHEGAHGTAGGKAYRDLILPRMAAGCGQGIVSEYYRFNLRGCVFLILDYLRFEPDGEQERWLVGQLEEASRTGSRIYLFAHPPLFLWGRHFFDNPIFSRRIEQLCRQYPVDAYFCGHTHNQTVSFHRTENDGRGFMQLTGSAVGYSRLPAYALDTFHCVADYGEDNRYLWGLFEDSAPGFFLVEIDEENTRIEWHSLNDKAVLTQPGRRAAPVVLKSPETETIDRRLSVNDLHQIKGAWLNVFSVIRGTHDSTVKINGCDLGPIPDNVSFAARRFLMLPEQALAGIGLTNQIDIRLPELPSFALGSISLELLLYDGRSVRSRVASENYVSGEEWKQYRRPERFRWCEPGSTVTVTVDFEAAE